MCTRYPIINRVLELKVHIELTRFVQPEKIEIDANERAVNEKSPYCFFVCTTFDSFLNDLSNYQNAKNNILYNQWAADLITRLSAIFYTYCGSHKFVQKKLLLLQKLGILNLHNRKNHVFAKFYACTSPGFWL